MQRRKAFVLLTTPIVAAALIVSAGPASAAVNDVANSEGYVIVEASQGITTEDGATFYPTGPIRSDTLIVIAEPDGSLPDGLTEAKLSEIVAQQRAQQRPAATERLGFTVATDNTDAAAGPSLTAAKRAYAATSAGWSSEFTGGSVFGFDWSATVQYNFWAAGFTSQRNAGQGLGYYRGYKGGTYGIWSQWFYLGSATSSGGGSSVPWGNVIGTAKFKARCSTSTLCTGYFSP